MCARANYFEDCNLFAFDGSKITSCRDIYNGSSVVIVPADRPFIYAGVRRGYRRVIKRLGEDVSGKPIVLETSSVMPRIFKLENFFTDAEASQLIANAIAFSGDVGLQRSQTGAGSKQVTMHPPMR